MSLMIDPRAGSVELIAPLSAAGLPVEETTLLFGDIAFVGRGEGGTTITVGLEHKKLGDLVNSLDTDRLVGHQLPGMLRTYERGYLVIEGDWDTDDSGRIVVPSKFKHLKTPLKGAPPASVLLQRVWTLEHRGGLRVFWAKTQKETIRYVCSLYRAWTDRDLDQHRSHLAMHAPDLDKALLQPVSLKRQIAAQLPGVGYTKSEAVDRHFPTITAMINAPEEDWMLIDGIGKTLARRIVQACQGV